MDQPYVAGELDDAITSHDNWRMRLHSAAVARERSLPVATIARADQCRLGRWLCGCPAPEGGDDPLAQVRRRHNAFHQEAGRIAAMIEAGQFEAALRALSGSEFSTHTRALRDAIEGARAEVKASHGPAPVIAADRAM
ncbi:CZB domain-containing protein [Mesobacterium pallidum]|uniref:CZB domain-containing protein n=1 Tax=Mesobacterium pallidum TaxID=2872037 RepID=UPI001EE31EC5|nr:CZB domain-containing protein [Mesobacterium pallidum]